jgi:hypothetical protein
LKPAKTVRTEQERAGTNQTGIIESEIDHILATEDGLLPTSGFVASVMERVQEEAATPPSIPFPWKRAIPGILLTAGALAWGTFELVRLGPPGLGLATLSSTAAILPHLSPAVVASVESAGWVALALGASLVSWLLSRRLAGRGGLL